MGLVIAPGYHVGLPFTLSKPLHKHPELLVFGCTILGAAAQILMKTGANALTQPSLIQMITNVPLMVGYTLYGMSTMLLILALREGHLSLLYPIISLTYVWVTLLSIAIFDERMNWFKGIGLAIIVSGVALLGRNGRE
jgi:uncharacterized membrane protein